MTVAAATSLPLLMLQQPVEPSTPRWASQNERAFQMKLTVLIQFTCKFYRYLRVLTWCHYIWAAEQASRQLQTGRAELLFRDREKRTTMRENWARAKNYSFHCSPDMKLLLVLCAESGHTQSDFVAAVAKQGLYYTLSFVDCSLFVVMAKMGRWLISVMLPDCSECVEQTKWLDKPTNQ